MKQKSMRAVFGEQLAALGAEYPQLVVLDSDTSGSTQTKIFGEAYPERFFNCGIAENNMLGMAAGMAACGCIPVAAAFAFLIALRAGDNVRSLIAYNHLNVKLAGCYCGLSDFADGGSHQSLEDIGVLRSIPGITILSPSDVNSTAAAVKAMIEYEGPVYIRLSRQEVGRIHPDSMNVEIGRGYRLRAGGDVTIAATGAVTAAAMEAARLLEQEGISADVLDCISLKPFDEKLLLESVAGTRALVTVEEHSILGGLGSAAAEILAENCPVPMIRIGTGDCFGESGPYEKLLVKNGICAENIARQAKRLVLSR